MFIECYECEHWADFHREPGLERQARGCCRRRAPAFDEGAGAAWLTTFDRNGCGDGARVDQAQLDNRVDRLIGCPSQPRELTT
jgi:hypothetical protein